tara:strand:+ start:1740 stop:2201 length:462 start_codon:yes stop_codon:yes gene_type:complete
MKHGIKGLALVGAVAVLVVLSMPTQLDAMADEKMLKYRNSVMWSLTAHLGGIFQNMKGEVNAKANIPHHAKALAPIAASILAMFPHGSDGGRTKPEIWSDWEGFEKAAAGLVSAANALAVIADSGDISMIGAAARAVGKACGDCHKPYRAPRN